MKTLRPYQAEAVQKMARANYLLADDCGLGKTFTTIKAVLLGRRYPIDPYWCCLVICPMRVRSQWEQEINECDPTTPVTILQYGLPLSFQTNNTPPFGWYILHYEAVLSLGTDLTQLLWDVVICDEAHRLKNRNTLWTIAIKHIPAARKFALTGTPMEKGPQDLWSILNWTHPDIHYFKSYWRFVNTFVEQETTWLGYQKLRGAKNVDKLSRLLRTMMLKRTKIEVEPDLPPRIHQDVILDMSDAQAEVYEAVDKSDDIVVEVQDKRLLIKNVLALIIRLQQIASYPPLLGLDAPSVKVEWVKGWLDDNPNKQVVIFTRFRPFAEALAVQFDGSLIVGGVLAVPKDWLRGEKQVIVGTIDAMSEGIDGLQQAGYAIFMDQQWSTIHMSQAYDRVHRMNIDHPKVIYTLLCKGTKDFLVKRAIEEKWDDARLVYEAIHERANETGSPKNR